MAEQIIFYVLAIVIIAFTILSVTSRRILRAATYLLFVLIATAGLYLLMGYQFLAGVQIFGLCRWYHGVVHLFHLVDQSCR